MAANKLDIIGHDGSTFDWLNPQPGMELIHGLRVLTLAMYSRTYYNISTSAVNNATNIYYLLQLFKWRVDNLKHRYVRRDVAVGDTVVNYTSLGLTWEYLEAATGEDLAFLENLVYGDTSPELEGKLCDPHTLTILYKVLNEFQEYLAYGGSNLKFDSYAAKWVNYGFATGNGLSPQIRGYFSGSLDTTADPIDQTNRNDVYNNLMSFVNDSSNYAATNSFQHGLTSLVEPRPVGVEYKTSESTGETPYYNFDILGANGFNGHADRLTSSFNFGYLPLSDNGSDIYAAGGFRNIFPDANTIYKQYLWGTRGQGGNNYWQAPNYNNFGSGINELEVSYIQTAYNADGYILRTAPLTFDLSLAANTVNLHEGIYVEGVRSFVVNDERFSDYRTATP